ncbi:MAG: MFS transporter [Polyangiaceae bacterium]
MSVEPARDDAAPPPPSGRRFLGIQPMKLVFALEYVLQGLANPFQGITYQPFFKHLRGDFGLSEAATQSLFARSYLAWSFKPVLGFFIDAYGRTRTLLIALLGAGAVGYAVTPWVDTSAVVFFWFMFALSVLFAATDVAVDRATVIAGDEEAKATGRSRASTVGLNQAICWTAIYGTGIVAAVLGGYTADEVRFNVLMVALAAVPLLVLGAVLLLPRDRAVPVPITRSMGEFWRGLNSGPLLGVMLFYFVFHFQPALGALWNNYLIETLNFSQTQIGVSDGASSAGAFVGVLLFAWKGIAWQERLGLRRLFRLYIVASILISLTQYLQVDPWFSIVARGLSAILPFWDESTVRVVYLCTYSFLLAIPASSIRMSTFSVVGAVIPPSAAGSLFAGFMSVANLAYSMSYASGAWLYDHGTGLGLLRSVQQAVFGIGSKPGDSLSVNMLILMGSFAYLTSFVCVHVLPDRRQTLDADAQQGYAGPERWGALEHAKKRRADLAAVALGALLLATLLYLELDPVSSALIAFFVTTGLRKLALDAWLARTVRA